MSISSELKYRIILNVLEYGLHVDHLEYGEMVIERAHVYNLLEAMLISKTTLSDALSSRQVE
ncbi:hypothetical protein IEQ34_000756 [Dendrobium chrysotoxum]|uniref:Uncharacterized protein n=1 Tax=Dendrobium chrysotoxum TaxID=161865 RepID=A0AAV7HU26_DENCH|nr:hypothetical protein IEQ34_000756 [Dendrobium chrysotoxum]